jgi:hypothetical protein
MDWRVNRAFDAHAYVTSKTIGHADLTAAATSQAIALAAAARLLPAGAQILGVDIDLSVPFSGGGASAVSVDIGTTGDTDAIVDGANLFAAAVGGKASTRPPGISPNARLPAGGNLFATFISDVNVVDLAAGSCTIHIVWNLPCRFVNQT